MRSMLWGAVKEDPVIGWGPGVEEVVVGGWGQGVGARGGVRVEDKEVSDLPGNACAWIFVLGSDHAHAPAIVLPFEEDGSVEQGRAFGMHGFECGGVRWVLVECKAWLGEERGESRIVVDVSI